MLIKESTIFKNLEPIAENMLQHCEQLYEDSEYASLGVLLGYLRSLTMMYQSYHWQTVGEAQYGDHLLFAKLYETSEKFIDPLAEKAIGVGSPKLTNYWKQTKNMLSFMQSVYKGKSLIEEAYLGTMTFVAVVEVIKDKLKESSGVDNILCDIVDALEGNIYLLKQRLNQ